jgi:hypothetical protein
MVSWNNVNIQERMMAQWLVFATSNVRHAVEYFLVSRVLLELRSRSLIWMQQEVVTALLSHDQLMGQLQE